MSEALLQCEEEKILNELWKEGQNIMLRVAEETISKKKSKIDKWISDETMIEVEKRRKLKAKGIKDTVEEAIYKQQNSKFNECCGKTRKSLLMSGAHR